MNPPSEAYLRTCKSKRRYYNKEDALIRLSHYIERGDETITIYKCRRCRRLHLGHPQHRRRKRIH